MDTLDLEDTHIGEMTIEEFIETIIDLAPTLKVIEALRKSQERENDLVERLGKMQRLLNIITKERDEAIARLKSSH